MNSCCGCIAQPSAPMGVAITDMCLGAFMVICFIIGLAAGGSAFEVFLIWFITMLFNGILLIVTSSLTFFARAVHKKQVNADPRSALSWAMASVVCHGVLIASCAVGSIMWATAGTDGDDWDSVMVVCMAVWWANICQWVAFGMSIHFLMVMLGFKSYVEKSLNFKAGPVVVV